MNELISYMGKTIRVACTDGTTVFGLCDEYQEEYPGECEESITISSEGKLIEITRSEIKAIEIIEA